MNNNDNNPTFSDPPGYPSVTGQRIPDLDLAGFGFSQNPVLALGPEMGGHIADSIPPQRDGLADLVQPYDIGGMGISDEPNAIPFFDLNLANNTTGFLSPSQLFHADQSVADMHPPSYLVPDFYALQALALRPGYDLTSPGIDLIPPFASNPQHAPDLLQFDQPKGLDVMIAGDYGREDLMQSDPMLPDTGEEDRPDGLQMPADGVETADPALPDLQHPTLAQETEMASRPGDLADDALSALHSGADYRAAQQSDYPDVQFDIAGDNQARRRKQELLTRGLDATGREK